MNDGGPAFPVLHSIDQDAMQAHDGSPEHRINHVGFGMSLRDWFAGMALQGLLAHGFESMRRNEVTQVAYEYADAMLEGRP